MAPLVLSRSKRGDRRNYRSEPLAKPRRAWPAFDRRGFLHDPLRSPRTQSPRARLVSRRTLRPENPSLDAKIGPASRLYLFCFEISALPQNEVSSLKSGDF